MKNRGLGKKGQEAVSNFGVTGIILIVFLVVVVLGIWAVNNYWGDTIVNVPKNAEIIAQACSVYAKESTLNSYCFDFREVRKDTYTTCDYAKNYNIIILDSDGSDVSRARMEGVCSEYSSYLNNSICTACNSTNGGQFSEKPKTKINGKSCSDWLNGGFCNIQ